MTVLRWLAAALLLCACEAAPDEQGLDARPAPPAAPSAASSVSSGASAPAPRVAWSSGRDVHHPDGTTTELDGDVLQLVRSGSSLLALVAGPADHDAALVRLLPGRAPQRVVSGLAPTRVAVSPDAGRLAAESVDRRDRVVVGLRDGTEVRQRFPVNRAGTPVGWVGDDVLLTTGDGAGVRAERWTPGTGLSQVLRLAHWNGLSALSADGRHVLARQGDGPCRELAATVDLTTTWSSCEIGPSAFSPHGDRLVSLAGVDLPGPLLVRAVPDGGLVTRLAVDSASVRAVGWEDDDHVLAVRVDEGQVLVHRCAVAPAGCVVAARARSTDASGVAAVEGG
jgi:hypothetical protein